MKFTLAGFTYPAFGILRNALSQIPVKFSCLVVGHRLYSRTPEGFFKNLSASSISNRMTSSPAISGVISYDLVAPSLIAMPSCTLTTMFNTLSGRSPR